MHLDGFYRLVEKLNFNCFELDFMQDKTQGLLCISHS